MSKKSSSPAAYGDCKYVMDLALKKPGLRYAFETPGPAVHFKQRCNRYRNMLREQQEELYAGVPGQRASTAYDILVIRMTDLEGKTSRRGEVLIFDHEIPKGKLLDPETGEEIAFLMPTLFGEDDDDEQP